MRLLAAPLLGVFALGCATTPVMVRRLERPQAALGDAHTLGLDVIADQQFDTFPDGARVSTLARSRFATYLEERAHFSLCSPAPCGDGTLKILLRDVHLSAPMTERAENVVEFGADVTFVPIDGSPRTLRMHFSSIEAKIAPDVKLRSLVDDAARAFAERFVAQSTFREVPLQTSGGLGAGVDLLRANEFSSATKIFREVTQRQPSLWGAWFDLGFALELQGQWQSALKAYQRAAELEPTSPDAAKAVAELSRMLSN